VWLSLLRFMTEIGASQIALSQIPVPERCVTGHDPDTRIAAVERLAMLRYFVRARRAASGKEVSRPRKAPRRSKEATTPPA
jgi:hypothetical protein